MENNCNATLKEELENNKKRKNISYTFNTDYSNRDIDSARDWFSFHPVKSYFKFSVEAYGYFDPRPQIKTNASTLLVFLIVILSVTTLSVSWFHLLLLPFLFFGWGDIYLKLPLDSKKDDEVDGPEYGFYMYHVDPTPGKINFPTCFIWRCGNYNSWDLPWAYTWIRTSVLLKNLSWAHETKGSRKDFYEDQWKNVQYVVDYNFIDKTDGQIIPTKVYVVEREWRQHWLKCTSLFAKVVKSIDVHFTQEVGSQKGSWKGGTLGCGYTMKKGETALECIKRMELEKDFR